MDRLTQTKEALRKYFADWIEYHPEEQTGIPLRLIEDHLNGDFLLIEQGHSNNGYVYSIFAHLKVLPDGVIAVLRNNTDIEIGEELREYNIPNPTFRVEWLSPVAQAMLGEKVA